MVGGSSSAASEDRKALVTPQMTVFFLFNLKDMSGGSQYFVFRSEKAFSTKGETSLLPFERGLAIENGF